MLVWREARLEVKTVKKQQPVTVPTLSWKRLEERLGVKPGRMGFRTQSEFSLELGAFSVADLDIAGIHSRFTLGSNCFYTKNRWCSWMFIPMVAVLCINHQQFGEKPTKRALMGRCAMIWMYTNQQ